MCRFVGQEVTHVVGPLHEFHLMFLETTKQTCWFVEVCGRIDVGTMPLQRCIIFARCAPIMSL
jgi:hypothetical protein